MLNETHALLWHFERYWIIVYAFDDDDDDDDDDLMFNNKLWSEILYVRFVWLFLVLDKTK